MSRRTYAHAAGDIVAIIGKPGRGKTWASERYCAGRTNAFYLSVSSAVFSLPGLLSLVGEAIGAGRHTVRHWRRRKPSSTACRTATHSW